MGWLSIDENEIANAVKRIFGAGGAPAPNESTATGRKIDVAGGGTDRSSVLEGYIRNPTVSAALNQAWAQSHSKGFTDQRREVNLFGRRNAEGDVWVEAAPSSYASSDRVVAPDPAEGNPLRRVIDRVLGNKTVFVIHTHPNPGDYKATGPSDDDISYARKWGVPLIIQGSDGLHFYDPQQHKP